MRERSAGNVHWEGEKIVYEREREREERVIIHIGGKKRTEKKRQRVRVRIGFAGGKERERNTGICTRVCIARKKKSVYE